MTNNVTDVLTPSERLYQAAKTALGTHQTLNDDVPAELGCAEAWSSIARSARVQGIPENGFAGTIAVADFMRNSPDFEQIMAPEPGATLVSISTGSKHGHIAFFAQFGLQYPEDWGLISNDSNTATVREQWSLKEWMKYYQQELGLLTQIYRWKG